MVRLVSGGQTGADRAALEFAVATGRPYGGWCPAGGWAEDLPDPPGLLARYPQLHEAPSADPNERTQRNVRDSDATLVVLPHRDSLASSSGGQATCAAATALGRPLAAVVAGEGAVEALRQLLDDARAVARGPGQLILNVAGPRESEAPGTFEATYTLLVEAAAAGLI
jgi:hypothetical protein